MNKKNESIEKLTLRDWLNFLQNTKNTDICLMIGSAGLVTAIFAVGFSMIVFSIKNIITISGIFLLAIWLSIYYFLKTRSLMHRSLLKEIEIASKLINAILKNEIKIKNIKDEWFK